MADDASPIVLAERLRLPRRPSAMLWDMDGTVLDSLALDLAICNELLRKHLRADVRIHRTFIRDHFAFDPARFWNFILERIEADYGIAQRPEVYHAILQEYEQARHDASFDPCPGAREVLEDARGRAIPLAIVSNNAVDVVKNILRRSGVEHVFDAVVGNDYEGLQKKPAPDTYLLAAKMLGVDVGKAVVLEDSIIGVEAGKKAGSYVVGLATGGTTFEALAACEWADVVYADLTAHVAELGRGAPPRIATPLEHVDRLIAAFFSRAPRAIELAWKNNDWEWLGATLYDLSTRAGGLGEPQRQRTGENELEPRSTAERDVATAPDELVELAVLSDDAPGFELLGAAGVGIEALRDPSSPHQKENAAAMRMLSGMARAAHRRFRATVLGSASPVTTWEAIFRAIGQVGRIA